MSGEIRRRLRGSVNSVAYYQDLSPCDYFGHLEDRLRAVGWLEHGEDFSRGVVSREFAETLARLLVDAWQPMAFAGAHLCSFCRFSGGPGVVRIGEIEVRVGATNLFVPGTACVFVSPSLILHYIDSHEYCPPEEFQAAVMGCPPMKSIQYLRALRAQKLSLRNEP
jgi:hypothetical protein